MRKVVLVTLLVVAGVAAGAMGLRHWTNDPDRVSRNELRAAFDHLAGAIEGADTIVLTEHSDRLDERRSDGEYIDLENPKYEYSRTTLNTPDRIRLVSALRKVDPGRSWSRKACSFVPHHTLTLTRAGKETKLRICFACSQVRWEDDARFEALIPIMKEFVRSQGMNPDADWEKRYVEAEN